MFIYFERERDRVRVGEGQRERETQNPKQAPGSELLAQRPWESRRTHWRLHSLLPLARTEKSKGNSKGGPDGNTLGGSDGVRCGPSGGCGHTFLSAVPGREGPCRAPEVTVGSLHAPCMPRLLRTFQAKRAPSQHSSWAFRTLNLGGTCFSLLGSRGEVPASRSCSGSVGIRAWL